MSSAVNMVKRGSVVGTGAAKKVILGFKPAVVHLHNVDGLVSAYKTDSMEDDKALKEVTAGTKTFPASMVTIESDGFTIGTDADLNVSGERIEYTAWQGRNE